MRSTTRSRLARGASLTGAGALVLTALAAVTPAASAVATPSFAYLAKNVALDQVLRTNDAVGTADGAAAATPDGYQVYGYDASWDGKTWAACMGSGPAGVDAYDRTYALVLTHTVDGTPATTQTKVLSTFCETAPVVSGDGAHVYWLADDQVYKHSATYDGANGAITGSTTVVSRSQFVTAHNSVGDHLESVLGFAVSPDGTAAAAIYRGATTYRIKASKLATAAPFPDYSAKTYTVTSTATNVPQPLSFTFSDADTLLWTFTNTSSVPTKVIYAYKTDLPATLNGANNWPAGVGSLPNLNGVYDLHAYSADGGTTTSFFGWKDTYDGAGAFVDTKFGSTDDPAGNVAPASWTPRADGATTYRYVPVATDLPVLEQAVNRAVAHPELTVSAGTRASVPVVRKSTVGYFSANYYLTDPTGAAYLKANAAETDKGTLVGCITATCADGEWTAFAPVSTSGKNVFAVGTKWYNGSTPQLSRNTTLRWSFAGDLFTEPSDPTAATANVRVYVRPIITVKKSISGSYTTVYGYAHRNYGVPASLMRYTSLGWRTVASVTTTNAGGGGAYAGFNFGKRLLPRGTYKVVIAGSSANGNWAAGAQLFSV